MLINNLISNQQKLNVVHVITFTAGHHIDTKSDLFLIFLKLYNIYDRFISNYENIIQILH
jgi:hypothetical protein